MNTAGKWCAHVHYSDQQQWLQANIGPNDSSNGMVMVVKTTKPDGEASLVISYLLNKSRDGKDWTALETPLSQFEGVSIYVPLRSK